MRPEAVFLLLVAVPAWGQPAPPAFRAADVHASAPGVFENVVFLPTGRFEAYGQTMLSLIRIAWQADDERIADGPAWLDQTRFDVIAQAPRPLPEAQMAIMLRSLLTERFGLVVRSTDQPKPAFVLTVARPNAQLKKSAGSAVPDCQISGVDGQRNYVCQNITLAGFSERMRMVAPAYVNHPVIDQTGLMGAYDFTVNWTSRGYLGAGGTSFFDAIDKQLGLRLEAREEPMSVLSIASVNEKPIPNPPDTESLLPHPPKEFEAADIKPSRPDTRTSELMLNGRVEMKGVTLRDLIASAWLVDDNMVAGGAKWMETDRFDLIAKTELTGSIDALRFMLQKLLADRFELAVHREDRPVSIYGLSVKRAGKLKPSEGDARSACTASIGDGMKSYNCRNTTMEQLASKIEQWGPGYLDGNSVVDLTGLKGQWDFDLSFSPKNRIIRKPDAAGDVSTPEAPIGITLSEALDRDLGLKLGNQKRPASMVVIDHANRTPTSN